MVITFKKTEVYPVTTHFLTSEFACKCRSPICTESKIDLSLAYLLEYIRMKLSITLRISSGYRCKDHNEFVGGTNASQHVIGKAADILISKPHQQELIDNIVGDIGGVGFYDNFTHVDVRGKRARWDMRS